MRGTIIEAALPLHRCAEDLQMGQPIDGLILRNPFS